MRAQVYFSAIMGAAMLLSSVASAQDCAGDIQSAMTQSQTSYLNGMSGLASNSFSSRPGTYASAGCLDKFMKGQMDVMFKPPALTDLLGLVLNFACQQATQAISGAASGTNLSSLIGPLSGGLSIGGSTINLNQVMGSPTSSTTTTSGLSSIFH